MIWGRIFEDAIAEVIKADNPEWRISPMRVFAYNDSRMGSSFDRFMIHPEKGNCLLEIKMTSYREFKEKYIDDGEFIEAPAYYEVQCQHQLEVIDDYEWICLAVAIVDTRQIKYIWRQRDRDFGRSLRERVEWFWNLTEPPAPDLVKDSDLLARMHRAVNTETTYDATDDGEFLIAAMSYKQEGERETKAKEAKQKARSEMILKMGDNRNAWCNGYKVTNKAQFRVTEVKGK
jgi:predicted phage-related endonuclease